MEIGFEQARLAISEHILLALWGPQRRPESQTRGNAAVHGRHAFVAGLALDLAPVRVSLSAAGFVDTPLSASLLGDQLDARRNQLRATLPTRRVVGPPDVAALAIHIMINETLTGATYDIDGVQQLVDSPVLAERLGSLRPRTFFRPAPV
jgi:NAD(P)-dependent dehydrogenase (short-subunit alcohol dehydrogenase family)